MGGGDGVEVIAALELTYHWYYSIFGIIMAKDKMITTNLRIPKHEWLQIRAIAAEKGLSANEYIRRLIKKRSVREMIAIEEEEYENAPIWDLPYVMKGADRKPMGASEDDQLIYDH